MPKGPAPQLANSLKGAPKRGVVFEPKYDGHRVIVHKVGDDLAIYSRTFKSQLGKLPHVEAAMRAIPFDFTLDGEVVSVASVAKVECQDVLISSFGETQSVMGSGAGRKMSGRNDLTLVVFDCLSAQGKNLTDVPDVLRRGAAELIVDQLRLKTENVVLTPRWSQVKDYEALLREIVKAGGEGLMVKNPLAAYRSGRTDAWLKLKPVDTADVVIMGYKPGKDSFKGLVGAVTFGQYKEGVLVPRTDGNGDPSAVSGFDMAQRREFTENGNAYIGKVMEIAYNGTVGSNGTFRFPQFKHIRDDKTAEECGWDE